MSVRLHLLVFVVAMIAGLVFSSFSTYDFVQHLDRQVHDLHCSFVPGLAETGRELENDCQVTLMSPYSSVLRSAFWGGIPISLPAMGVFAFLIFRGIDGLSRPQQQCRASTAVTFAMSALPLLTSIVMGTIALFELDAACKLCIGIYGSSLVGFLAAGLAYASTRRVEIEQTANTGGTFVMATIQLGLFVAVPVGMYMAVAPDFSRFAGTCGELKTTEDPHGVLVALDDNEGPEVIEVLDPLCPTCRGFEDRLKASGLEEKIHRKLLLFPLDECNWNVDAAMHPGACTVSKAVLCADDPGGPSARQVLEWAFEVQPELREAAKKDPDLVRKRVQSQFPELSDCIESDAVGMRLDQSMRWAVKNSLRLLTPQVYVEGTSVCREDTDLGLEYTLSHLIERHNQGERR